MRILLTILACAVLGAILALGCGYVTAEPSGSDISVGGIDLFFHLVVGGGIGAIVGLPLGIYVDARSALRKSEREH